MDGKVPHPISGPFGPLFITLILPVLGLSCSKGEGSFLDMAEVARILMIAYQAKSFFLDSTSSLPVL